MKKKTRIILALALLLLLFSVLLSSCGSSAKDTKTEQPKQTEQPKPTEAPKPTDPPKPKDAVIKDKDDIKLATSCAADGKTITAVCTGNTSKLEYAWYLEKETNGKYEKVATVPYQADNQYKLDAGALETGTYVIKAFARYTKNNEFKRSVEAVHFTYDAAAGKLVVSELLADELTLRTEYKLEGKTVEASCSCKSDAELEYAWYVQKDVNGKNEKVKTENYGTNTSYRLDVGELESGDYNIKVFVRLKDVPTAKVSEIVINFSYDSKSGEIKVK